MYAFSRRFYPKRLTVHSGYTFSQSALLLALASAKRIGDLHAFSVDSDCIHFGPGDCGVTLWPRITCLKSLSTPFRTQTVSLAALSSESSTSRDANAQISCAPSGLWGFTSAVRPVFGNLTSYLVCYGGVRRAISKQRLPTGLWTLSRLLIRARVRNAPFTLGSTQQGYRLLCVVERYVYSGYMLCSRLVFSEYLCQVLQAGRQSLAS